MLQRRAQQPTAKLLHPVCVVLPAQQPIAVLPLLVVYPNTVPKLVGVAADGAPPTSVLLIYNPLLSTRIRSQVPAPINTVHIHPAAPGKLPITVFSLPVVIKQPALSPIPMLLQPVVLPESAPYP